MTIREVASTLNRSRDFVEKRLHEFRGVERRGRTYEIPAESVLLWKNRNRIVRPSDFVRGRNQPVSRSDRFAEHRERVRRVMR